MHHGGLARSGPQVWGFPSSPKCNCSGVVHPGDRGRVCYLFDFTHRKSKQRERQKDFPKVIQNICSAVQFPKSKFSQRPTLFLDSSYPGTVSVSAAQERQHCLSHVWMFTLLQEVLQSSEMIGASALSYGELTVLSW